jgi:hypothetical protein
LTVNRKWLPYTIILVLGLALFLVKRFQHKGATPPDVSDTGLNRNHGFDRRTTYLEYTKHAKCRMDCRQISQSEVEEIMRDGKINYAKSNVKATPCPSYALEGITHDDQRVRIVYGQCDQKTKVITVIDLDKEWSCDCPGDDGKYKNRN